MEIDRVVSAHSSCVDGAGADASDFRTGKKVWVSAGDIVLVGLREYQDDKVDIIHKYNADEARNLKQYGELPETARINETAVDMAMEGDDANDDIGIDFDEI